MEKRVYISGKITGIEADARVLFLAAELRLLGLGFEVVNPMGLPHGHDGSWESFMREDLKAMCDCGVIYMLRNWRESRGAIIEHSIALLLGMVVLYEVSDGQNG